MVFRPLLLLGVSTEKCISYLHIHMMRRLIEVYVELETGRNCVQSIVYD